MLTGRGRGAERGAGRAAASRNLNRVGPPGRDRRVKRRGKGPSMLFVGLRRRGRAPIRATRSHAGDVQIQERARVGWGELEQQIVAASQAPDAVTPRLTANHRLLVTPTLQPSPGSLSFSSCLLKNLRLGCSAADLVVSHVAVVKEPRRSFGPPNGGRRTAQPRHGCCLIEAKRSHHSKPYIHDSYTASCSCRPALWCAGYTAE